MKNGQFWRTAFSQLSPLTLKIATEKQKKSLSKPEISWAAGSIGALVGIFLLGASASTFAADLRTDARGYAGGLLGVATISGDGSSGTGVAFGLNSGYFFTDYLGLGAYLRSSNDSNNTTFFSWGGEILGRFANVLPGLHLGVQLGSGKLTYSGIGLTSKFNWGFKAAYDVPVSENYPVSLGLDVSVSWIKPANTTLSLVAPEISAKYWF